MQSYKPQGFSLLPTVVKNLLIINGLMFFATQALRNFGIDLNDILGLHYPFSESFKPYQIITYMFMHGNFMHLFMNMFAVWMFGSAIENLWGTKRFIVYYLFTGIGAAVLHYAIVYFQISPEIALMEQTLSNPSVENFALLSDMLKSIHPEYINAFSELDQNIRILQNNPQNQSVMNICNRFVVDFLNLVKNSPNVVGASGSLFGLLLAFGMMFPHQKIYLMFFPFGIKAKYFVMIYGAWELYSGIAANQNDNVAHFAHLGGLLFGFLLIKYWQHNRKNPYY